MRSYFPHKRASAYPVNSGEKRQEAQQCCLQERLLAGSGSISSISRPIKGSAVRMPFFTAGQDVPALRKTRLEAQVFGRQFRRSKRVSATANQPIKKLLRRAKLTTTKTTQTRKSWSSAKRSDPTGVTDGCCLAISLRPSPHRFPVVARQKPRDQAVSWISTRATGMAAASTAAAWTSVPAPKNAVAA